MLAGAIVVALLALALEFGARRAAASAHFEGLEAEARVIQSSKHTKEEHE